jgi:16S rRNA (guanine527-N7)-methyltransferase
LNGKSVSRETESRLQQFGLLFQKWAKTINLVAPSTIQDLWSRHIADSAQLFQLNPKPGIWLDLGSGGGFPGIITAIFLAENAGSCVHLVESNHKKAAFLRTALREAGAPGTVHPVRIEDAPALIPHVDFVSARALAELDPLLGYIHPWAEKNPLLKAYLHKGRDYLREVEISNRRWQFDLVRHDSVVEADSVILEIDNLRKKSDNRG